MPVTATTLRLMRRLAIDLEAVTAGHERELIRAYVDAWDVTVTQLQDALLQLAEEPITRTRLLRSARVASALQVIAGQLDGLAAQTAVVITDGAGQTVSIAVTAQAAIAATQLPKTAVGIQLATVNPDVVSRIIARTAEQITARTAPLSEAGQKAVREALIRGVNASDNPVKVARHMVKAARHAAVDLPLARAMAISRTELLDAARHAQAEWDRANTATLAGWEWLSARDVTTCPACWAKDGTLHELEEPGPLGHVNCRCTRLVRTKTWRELGIDLDEPDDARISAEDHFRTLSRDQQLQVMGPGRLAALDDGTPWSALAFEQHNPGWRTSWQATPVKDLAGASA
jgi:hypothetical protein